ncbi:MAG: ABC transporter permease [Propionibacteriaceae bacterium]|nr:ABC transporter permease [Propionibacteriaceae bacterium]
MGKYVLRRLLLMIPVLLGAILLVYFLTYALPGDPTDGWCGQRPCSAAKAAQLRKDFNLDKPFIVQYILYLGKLLQGDLGTNLYGNSVLHELSIRYPVTIKLTCIAVAFETVIGITAGILAGIRKGKFIDNLVTVGTLVFISTPIFVVGGLSQFIFGIKLHWAPVTSGGGTWPELIMPGLVLGAVSVAYAARLTRTSLVENLRADYVRTAKAKGLSSGRVFGIHTLRNSLIPVVTYIGASIGVLMGGAIVTETIFNINGVGYFLFRSITQRDGISVVGTVMVLVLIYLVVNLLVDLLYGVLDPRISHD